MLFIFRKHVKKFMIKVRKATLKDSKDIYEWRNDELTRKMSLSTNFVKIKPKGMDPTKYEIITK